MAWKPTAGPILTYDWERSGPWGAYHADVKMTFIQEVLDASKPDTIHLKDTLVLIEENAGLQWERADPKNPYTETWQLTHKADGEWASYDTPKEPHWPDEDLLSAPLIDIIYPEKPVRVGDKWSYHTTDATSARTLDFTYVGAERVGHWKCNKVSVALHVTTNNGEGGGKLSGSGTYWLDVKDGAVVKSDLQINEHEQAPLQLHEVIMRQA